MAKVKLLRVTEEGINLVAESARVSGVPLTQSSREIIELITDNDYSSALEHIYFTFDVSEISVALSRELLEHRIACLGGRTQVIIRYKGKIRYVWLRNLHYLSDKSGIEILMQDGSFKRINGFARYPYSGPLYKITLINGANFITDANHPNVTQEGLVKTRDLKVGQDALLFASSGVQNTSRGSYDLGRFAGLYAAEGSTRRGRLNFTFNSNEVEHIDFVKRFGESNLGCSVTIEPKEEEHKCQVYVGSSGIDKWIHNFVEGNTAKDKSVTSHVFDLGKEFLQGFTDGIFDGDGNKRGLLEIRSKQLRDDTANILCYLDKDYLMSDVFHKNRSKKMYQGRRENLKSYRLKRYTSPPKKQRRGTFESPLAKSWADSQGNRWMPIISVEKVRNFKGYIYNIELDEPHLFRLANGIVTHNSHTARSTRYMEEQRFGYHVPEELERKGKAEAAEVYRAAMKNADEAYTKLRELGVAREQARYVLPLALHTHYVVTMNVRSLINFFMLRLCVRASPEIRELAMRMYKICLEEYPDIFSKIWCRGFTLGVCPENEARTNECPFKKILPKKRDIKDTFEEQARRIIEEKLKTF